MLISDGLCRFKKNCYLSEEELGCTLKPLQLEDVQQIQREDIQNLKKGGSTELAVCLMILLVVPLKLLKQYLLQTTVGHRIFMEFDSD